MIKALSWFIFKTTSSAFKKSFRPDLKNRRCPQTLSRTFTESEGHSAEEHSEKYRWDFTNLLTR